MISLVLANNAVDGVKTQLIKKDIVIIVQQYQNFLQKLINKNNNQKKNMSYHQKKHVKKVLKKNK